MKDEKRPPFPMPNEDVYALLEDAATGTVTGPGSSIRPAPSFSSAPGSSSQPALWQVTAPPATAASPAKKHEEPNASALKLLNGLFAKFFGNRTRTKGANSPATAEETSANGNGRVENGQPTQPAGSTSPPTRIPNLRGRQATRRSWWRDLPAWGFSAVVHVTILCMLAIATFAPQIQDVLVKSIEAAPFDPSIAKDQAEEALHVLAEPAAAERDQAVGPLSTTMTVGSYSATGLGTGTGPPSATPALRSRGAGSSGGVGEGSLPNVRVGSRLSPVATLLPRVPSRDIGPGGVAGDVTAETKTIGEALDQMAREILRHLADHKLTVVWLFDESGSMRDDQQAVKEKFDRVATELKVNVPDDKKASSALTHVIVGFGSGIHFELPKPTTEIDLIGKAIDRLPVDETGIENTMQAVQRVIAEYGRLISKERRLLIVLVTDESGDDGAQIEEARQMAVRNEVPIYVIGRQSLFGYEVAHLVYTDPVTKDIYWPAIRRGPETPAPECLQYDGLHDRWDEQPSGFAPYELARLVKDSGGIYFLLPSEEGMRARQREQLYSMKTLKEYVPDYKSRIDYIAQRNKSELRSTIFKIVQETANRDPEKGLVYVHRREYPVDYSELEQAIVEEAPKAQIRLKALVEMERVLRGLKKHREREPDKRWQAHYDLILAQCVTYQVKAYEYLACIDEMVALAQKGGLTPKNQPKPGVLDVVWVLDHSKERKAPKGEIDSLYSEAEKLLKDVIGRHPKTPWADLAQDEINRGFGVQRSEWARNPQYYDRAKLVPKY